MHVDVRKRKETQTHAAISYVQSLAPTPVLLEIHFSFEYSPPSFYIVTKGFAAAVSRQRAIQSNVLLHVVYLANGEARLIWK